MNSAENWPVFDWNGSRLHVGIRKNWAWFASLIGSCKMNGVEPYTYLRDLFISLANDHL
ncbi:hypothetical protein FQZ97_1059740 [compost metagenome]